MHRTSGFIGFIAWVAAAWSSAAWTQEAHHYRFAYDQPRNTGYSIAGDIFADKLKALSKGTMIIDQYPGAQLGQELLARFVGTFHRRRAAYEVLNLGILVGAQLCRRALVNSNYLKSVLQSEGFGYLADLQRGNCRGKILFELALLEGSELALLSARSAACRRVLIDGFGEVLARAYLGNKAPGALIDFVSGVTLERKENLRYRYVTRSCEHLFVAFVK
jgi:hypothetical protein